MIKEITRYLEDLNVEQKSVVQSNENLYVTACPGSGKTRVLTRKIAYQATKYIESLKKIIAVTYTNRAANEIKERLETLGIEENNVWVGTIHQFCLEFIVYPFKMNLARISKGFTIIDDYTRREYLNEINEKLNLELESYQLAKIDLSLSLGYEIVESEYPKVAKIYHKMLRENKEIDFDMILLLAYSILSINSVVAINIAKNIRAIYVDEFQDTRNLQYEIIGSLTKKNLAIQTLFVGDIDQAIYGSLNGIAKSIEELEKVTDQTFISKTLYGCYRSTQRLVDFYSKFQSMPYQIESRGANRDEIGIIKYNFTTNKQDLPQEIKNIIVESLANNVLEEDICVISPQHYPLFTLSEYLKEELPNCNFDAITVSPIKVNDHSAFFKLAVLYFTESGIKVRKRKLIANEIMGIFTNEFGIEFGEQFINLDLLKIINSAKRKFIENDGVELYKFVTNILFTRLNISKEIYHNIFKQYEVFLKDMIQRINKNSLSRDLNSFYRMFKQNKGITITTAHKVKGEEYDTVIAINLLKGKIPHWEEVINSYDQGESSAMKLLYVICSRAKKNLYLFSEEGYLTGSGTSLTPTPLLKNVTFDYNE